MGFRKFLKDYFTFTRSERNGIIVLISIILILVVIRLLIPHIRKNITYDFSGFQDEISEFEKSISEGTTNLFFFNPNTATAKDFENLGLESRVIRNILKYRERGGIFREREDLRKIYGLDSAEYLRIEPFIVIPSKKDAARPDTNGYTKSVHIPDHISGDDRTSGDGLTPGERPISHDSRTIHSTPVPLNTSDSAALVRIHGIGPVLSARIIKYRNLLGGYVTKEQLLEVYGMTGENFENIRNAIYIDSAGITYININTADFNLLNHHPYLSEYQARALISYREINGKYRDIDEITGNDLLPDDVYMKIKPYLVLE
jgi:DNA uptake protein ComE-like DNA-binding protein